MKKMMITKATHLCCQVSMYTLYSLNDRNTHECFLNSRSVCITDKPLTITDSFLSLSNILLNKSVTVSSLKYKIITAMR